MRLKSRIEFLPSLAGDSKMDPHFGLTPDLGEGAKSGPDFEPAGLNSKMKPDFEAALVLAVESKSGPNVERGLSTQARFDVLGTHLVAVHCLDEGSERWIPGS